ncbi:MAG: protein kinase domain-containing protein [Luteolibacter sp.]
MKLPEMNGLEVLGLVGTGECGRVFAAKDDNGNIWTVKVFEGMAVNRGLLSRMVARLEEGGWPEGVAEVESADFDGRPACWILPLFAYQKDEGDEVSWVPDTLQHSLGQHPGESTWGLVRQIGEALAAMHRKRVAHGNLKPGNVFFDEAGGVKLVDWTLGNMPGIAHLEFTDALLYQPPEQLVDPSGYFEEEGYGWDVHAFGVLAFRLLTGEFPRCAESFAGVAPEPGETIKEGIHADASKMAKSLMVQEDPVWPSEPANELEKGFREWLDRCLKLSRLDRPVSMMEVMAGFAEVETKVATDSTREELLDRRRKAERFGRRVMFFAGMAAAACAVLGGLWYLSQEQLGKERTEREREKIFLDTKATDAVVKMQEAVVAKEKAEQEMEYEYDIGLARLEASRLIGDRLFSWAMEKGNRELPALDGRELRLKRLERYFEDFLVRNADIKSLDGERARARLQLAEISLAAGDAEAAERRLEEAIIGWTGGGLDADMKLRLGRDTLLLALLKQQSGDKAAAEAFVKARKALSDVPSSGTDVQRLEQLTAILDFSEAKIHAASGDDTKALEQLMSATKKLNELADVRPESAVLRSELAACYLSSATILEGIGSMGDATTVRKLAAAEMVELLQENPQDIGISLELAGCYGAMAEAAVLSGDVTSAEKVSSEAMKLLDEVLQRRPDSVVAATRKAAQLGLQAGLFLDKGMQKEALVAFDEGIKILERQGIGKEPMVDYRLALLWWQKGRMLGFSGERAQELEFLGKARETLRDLETSGESSGIRIEELQRSSAYLLGDLAHAYELSKKTKEAKEAYREAISLWERLVSIRPQSEEYVEGLEWTRQRAKGV